MELRIGGGGTEETCNWLDVEMKLREALKISGLGSR